MALERSTAVRVSLLPDPASTGTLPASSSVMATTRLCSSSVMVAASPVVPQGTSTSMPAWTCRRTSRRRAASSRAPVVVNGVTSAVPAPENERVMAPPSSPHSPSRTVRDVAQGAQLFAGLQAHRLLPRLALHEYLRLRPFPVPAIEEEVELAAGHAQDIPRACGDVARLPGVALPIVERGPGTPVVEGRVPELVSCVEGRAEVAVVLGEEPLASGAGPAGDRAQHARAG